MKKVLLTSAMLFAGVLCATHASALTRVDSQQPVTAEVKKEGKAPNYKVTEDKKAMNRIDNHARATGNSMDAALKKANAEAAAKHQREQAKKGK